MENDKFQLIKDVESLEKLQDVVNKEVDVETAKWMNYLGRRELEKNREAKHAE